MSSSGIQAILTRNASIVLTALLAFLAIISPMKADEEQASKALDQVREIGKAWNGDVAQKTFAIYTPILAKQKTSGIKVTQDIAYGSHERNKLDLFVPEGAKGLPVLVFIHGGGMRVGNKRQPETEGLAFANVGYFAANHGMIGITMNYRLVPDAHFPSAGQDVAAVAQWIQENIKDLGGDPGKVFFAGQSAGGMVLGEYLYNASVQPKEGPAMAGAIFLSSSINIGVPAVASVYFGGADEQNWSKNSNKETLARYEGKLIPTLVIGAELDPAEIEWGTYTHIGILCEKRQGCPRYTQLPRQNHISEVLNLNTDDMTTATPVLEFVNDVLSDRIYPLGAK
ncbi:alpha/beta hydrolase [Agrobacterium larrymoorei]|uniref:alpha/beta hydrolase n=2 Tax=Rhizobium/Agrobacterium group TaxID=227290 RepID=UPI00157249C0|nr:alpha/beta hydrolase [Agrobacterium larrymoorei]NTJ44968.1 alpha/beta hydrolase [Agrobacterium larrymoorei]